MSCIWALRIERTSHFLEKKEFRCSTPSLADGSVEPPSALSQDNAIFFVSKPLQSKSHGTDHARPRIQSLCAVFPFEAQELFL